MFFNHGDLFKAARALALLFKQVSGKFLGMSNGSSTRYSVVSDPSSPRLRRVRVRSGPYELEAYAYEEQPPRFHVYRSRVPRLKITQNRSPFKPNGDRDNFENLYPEAKVSLALRSLYLKVKNLFKQELND